MNMISQNQSKSFAFSKEKRYICIRIYVCKHVDGNIRNTRLHSAADLETWQYGPRIYFHASEISFHIQVVGIAHINDDPFVKQENNLIHSPYDKKKPPADASDFRCIHHGSTRL